jgi:transposase
MASIQPRVSRGIKYWSIVESKRVNGKPRTTILEYLGTADSLLGKLTSDDERTIKSYSHGDTAALLNIAEELGVIKAINEHIPALSSGKKPIRDGLTVGASLVLAAVGRACKPTSKLGWYDWCKETSLSYALGKSLKDLDSQHFWDQMDSVPVESIALIEDRIVKQLIATYKIKLDKVFFDTTNFFSFIDSANGHCDLPQRGKNKQKRYDLRQVGMALLVSRKDQFPLFHQIYRGNKNDVTVFKEVFGDLTARLRGITQELTDITIVFDKGNNSKENFALLDAEAGLHYVGGLVSSHFVDLITEANKNFTNLIIDDEKIPTYRIKRDVWGAERTCVVTVSNQLKEGQIRGIDQHLQTKYKLLEKLKQQLESPKRRKHLSQEEIKSRLRGIIKGQFIDLILKYELIELGDNAFSFTYFIDKEAYEHLVKEVLGRKILVTNQHDWSSEDIVLAYRGQSKVEYAFRTLKNPLHLAVRPQFHWTDQKISAHFLICIIGYLLTVAAYSKARSQAGYKRNISNFLTDLQSIRLACTKRKKSNKLKYELETIDPHLKEAAKALKISNETLRPKLNSSDYI